MFRETGLNDVLRDRFRSIFEDFLTSYSLDASKWTLSITQVVRLREKELDLLSDAAGNKMRKTIDLRHSAPDQLKQFLEDHYASMGNTNPK